MSLQNTSAPIAGTQPQGTPAEHAGDDRAPPAVEPEDESAAEDASSGNDLAEGLVEEASTAFDGRAVRSELLEIRIDEIDLDSDANPRKTKGIESLVASVGENGLLQLPTVKRCENGHYRPLAGFRRLAAVRDLGWEKVSVVVVAPRDDNHERLIALDSNLEVAHLSRPERARWLFDRKAIYERLHPESKRGAAGGHATAKNAVVDSFAAHAAELTDLSKRTIRADVLVWEKASPTVREAWLDGRIKANVVHLLVRKGKDDDEQDELLKLVIGKSLKQAKKAIAARRGKDEGNARTGEQSATDTPSLDVSSTQLDARGGDEQPTDAKADHPDEAVATAGNTAETEAKLPTKSAEKVCNSPEGPLPSDRYADGGNGAKALEILVQRVRDATDPVALIADIARTLAEAAGLTFDVDEDGENRLQEISLFVPVVQRQRATVSADSTSTPAGATPAT